MTLDPTEKAAKPEEPDDVGKLLFEQTKQTAPLFPQGDAEVKQAANQPLYNSNARFAEYGIPTPPSDASLQLRSSLAHHGRLLHIIGTISSPGKACGHRLRVEAGAGRMPRSLC